MSTRYNTGNPIESTDVRDMSDNAKNFDEFSNSMSESFSDRFGRDRQTMEGSIRKAGFQPASFDFFTGGNLVSGDRNKAVFNPDPSGDSNWYAWQGVLPKLVPAGSTPETSGGLGENAWKPVTNNILAPMVRGALIRCYTDAGLNIVGGSFQIGFTLVNSNDVALDETTGKAYSGSVGTYPAGTSTSGFTDESLSFYPALVDTYLTVTSNDTDAIDAAMAASKYVAFKARKYVYTKELVSTGHTLIGAVGETFEQSQASTIIEFDIPATPSSTFAFRNVGRKGFIQNIRFIQKNWNIALNGCRVDRFISADNIDFSYFNGHGCVLTSTDALSQMCYSSSIKSLTCDYNAKHGILLGGAANAVVLDNPKCRWNGSPSYGVKPTVPGQYDGLYSGGKNSDYPGNPGIFNDPQGVVLIGGDYSYNSRIGLNLDRFFDGVVLGGYGESNLVDDIKIRAMYGSNVVNFMSQQGPDVAVPGVDPLNPSLNILLYPNRIIIRGKSYGNGQQSSASGVYDQMMDSLRSVGTAGNSRIRPTSVGGVQAEQNGGGVINWHFGDLPIMARKAGFGDGFTDGTSFTNPFLLVRRAGDVEGLEAFRIVTGAQFTQMYVANGSGANAADTAMRIPKHSVTSRSINAGGTVNTTGADYAEYMKKADSIGNIEKGAICGVNNNGLLTDRFDDAVDFVVKSTDPSFVGGDNWFDEQEPIAPLDEDGWQNTESDEYKAAMASYKYRMEKARLRVDRIAFSGQVPCNVFGASPGDYIIPVRNIDGSIGGLPVAKPTFEQSLNSVGRVWNLLSDGRAWISVKSS